MYICIYTNYFVILLQRISSVLELLDVFFPTQIAAVKVKKPFPQITFPSSPLKWWKVKTMHLWTDAEHLTTIQIWSHMVKQQISQTPAQFMNFHGLHA